MNDKMQGIWKGRIVAQFRYYPSTGIERLRKTTENVRIGGIPAENLTENFSKTNLEILSRPVCYLVSGHGYSNILLKYSVAPIHQLFFIQYIATCRGYT
jgi:hypothetical protein